MTIAYACLLFMGLFPYVAAGIAKKGFEGYDNAMPCLLYTSDAADE